MNHRLALLVLLASCVPSPTNKQPPPAPPNPNCFSVPTEIDFGEVENVQSHSAQVLIRNPSASKRTLTFAEVAPPFSLDAPSGRVDILPFSSQTRTINFNPDNGQLNFGELVITEENPPPDAGVCELTIPLRGLGAGRIGLEPRNLELQVEPGEVAMAELRVVNFRRKPVTYDAQLMIDNDPFTLRNLSFDPASGTIPALESVTLTLRIETGSAGRIVGLIQLSARDAATGADVFTEGGGFSVNVGKPVAEVISDGLDPWRVGYVQPSNPPSYSTRRIVVRNVGSSGLSGNLALKLEQPGFELQAIQGGVDEIAVDVARTLTTGLLQGESAEISLQLGPRSVGMKEFKVQLRLNDPARPLIELMVRANVEALPACTMSWQPRAMLQLAPMPDGGQEGSVTFTNDGLTPCVIDDVRLSADSIGGYSLVSGGAPQIEVPAGESHVVTVAGHGATSAPIGSLRFHIFNRDTWDELVQLHSP